MGIVPAFVENRSVLEFGPGSGHNAIYTASLSPGTYELVEGNPKGVTDTRERLAKFSDLQINVYQCLLNSNCRFNFKRIYKGGEGVFDTPTMENC